MSFERRLERVKWSVLDEAPYHHNSGVAYAWAQRTFPDLSGDVLDRIVQRVLLELLDEGLIYFYWGEWDDGGDPDAPERPSRAEVEAHLGRGAAEPIPRTVWFTSTKAGLERLAEIPPETLFQYHDRQEWQSFVSRHPEFEARREKWLSDTTRWIEKGGRRPSPPSSWYDDFPGGRQPWSWRDSLPGSNLGNLFAELLRLRRMIRRIRLRGHS